MTHALPTATPKRIPYGVSDYRRMCYDNSYYVDKTHFIPLIEASPYYLFCIRPRRFGKSLWLSVLQYYYDLNYAEEFDKLFGHTYIGAHPTTERNSYGEKVIQGFLLAYLNIAHYFLIWPEHEMGGGFVDLYLQPFLARYPDMRYGYLIELKYIARSEFTQALLQEKISEAAAQLQPYLHDERVEQGTNRVKIKPLILVYNGWELVYQAEWDGVIPAKTPTSKRRKKSTLP